jgi:hypothetical protein
LELESNFIIAGLLINLTRPAIDQQHGHIRRAEDPFQSVLQSSRQAAEVNSRHELLLAVLLPAGMK